MGVPVICYKKILRKIEDHIIAQPSDTIEYVDDRLTYPLCRSRCYNFDPKSASLSQLSYITFTIYNLVH